MGSDWLHQINTICQQLLSDKSSAFVSFGINVALGLATIRFVLFGIGCTLRATEGFHGMDWSGFVRHILVIGCALTMVRGYNQPMAGIGQSFPDLILGGPTYLAKQIGSDSYKQIDDTFTNIRNNNPPGNVFNFSMTLAHWSCDILLTVCQAVMCLVMSYGYIASAVCALVGPIFIPFLLFEPLAFMFWGWFKCFLQYAVYPVIGAAFTHIFATLLCNVISDNTTTLEALLATLPLIILVVLGMMNAPKMCAALFSGGGEPGVGGLAASAVKMAAGGGKG